jgi:hypothetical protein
VPRGCRAVWPDIPQGGPPPAGGTAGDCLPPLAWVPWVVANPRTRSQGRPSGWTHLRDTQRFSREDRRECSDQRYAVVACLRVSLGIGTPTNPKLGWDRPDKSLDRSSALPRPGACGPRLRESHPILCPTGIQAPGPQDNLGRIVSCARLRESLWIRREGLRECDDQQYAVVALLCVFFGDRRPHEPEARVGPSGCLVAPAYESPTWSCR